MSDRIIKRMYARGQWLLKSPAHFGGDPWGSFDMALVRDSDGNPFIPGNSIAGAARSYLTKRLGEANKVSRLFGDGGANGHMSSIIVRDARLCNDHDKKVTISRDGIVIDPMTGTAMDNKKFIIEAVDARRKFELEFELILRDGDKKLEDCFFSLLKAFQDGEIRLGARTRRGYGRGEVITWDVRALSMDRAEHVMAWLKGDPWNMDSALVHLPLEDPTCDNRSRFKAKVDLCLKTSFLIRGNVGETNAPDVVHVHSNGNPVIPGTSIAGALRNRVLRIINTLNMDEEKIETIFGPMEGQRKKLWASKLTVEEARLKGVRPMAQARVAIDRFTGGSLSTALFDEAAVWPVEKGPHLSIEFSVEEPEDDEMGLLLLLIKDLYLGDLPLGGGVGIGRGVFIGCGATIELYRRGMKKTWSWWSPDEGSESIIQKDESRDLRELEDFVEAIYSKGGAEHVDE